jgi:hypothetical protein
MDCNLIKAKHLFFYAGALEMLNTFLANSEQHPYIFPLSLYDRDLEHRTPVQWDQNTGINRVLSQAAAKITEYRMRTQGAHFASSC